MSASQDKPVVVYDGECSFCCRQIERIKRRDRRSRFEFVPRNFPGLDARFPRLADGDFNTGMRLVTVQGEIFVGADALYHIFRFLPFWGGVAWLYRLPGLNALARLGYRWIAANRERLGRSCDASSGSPAGEADECSAASK
jgi:predicted DCC family thiol-disulfide oxidoreductase YuxK